ncbi:MAG: chemotaxis response regulator protein-glutamate methylesterase [Nitrospirae bacterium]|nr:chemotaxis response regulator protein-glutamate methylesterase [Nitrospirota bacterium]
MVTVVVVDDSFFIRRALKDMIESDGTVKVVGEAANGLEAIEKVAQLKPNVVTMDVEMPVMSGTEALRRLMQSNPLPVVMVSSLTTEGARATMEALELGAVDFVPKNLEGKTLNILRLKEELIARIRRAAGSRVLPPRPKAGAPPPAAALPIHHGTRFRSIIIGASTGGPRAVQEIIPRLPQGFKVPILVVQHMPPMFTQMFAERLGHVSALHVTEARDGDRLAAGQVYIAPGDHHLSLRRSGTEGVIHLTKDQHETLYRPSINTAMTSVAQIYPGACMGVLLTGMGNDGVEGLQAIRNSRGYTIAQDEPTCAVFGMPKAAIEAGVVDRVLPIDRIAAEIIQHA